MRARQTWLTLALLALLSTPALAGDTPSLEEIQGDYLAAYIVSSRPGWLCRKQWSRLSHRRKR